MASLDPDTKLRIGIGFEYFYKLIFVFRSGVEIIFVLRIQIRSVSDQSFDPS